MASLTGTIKILPKRLNVPIAYRTFAVSARRMAEGDTGAMRRGGQAQGDSWTRREKAAEDMYIRNREKDLMKTLKEKISAQEAVLAKDKAILAMMHDHVDHAIAVEEVEEKWRQSVKT